MTTKSLDPYFGLLPTELVVKILRLCIYSETPFCFEYCARHHDQPSFASPSDRPSTAELYGRPKLPLKTSQSAHLFDWFRVNGTSRRFREVGKPVFWQCKTIVISKDFATEVDRRPLHRGLTPGDRETVLKNVRSAIIYGIDLTSVSFYIGLPRFLAPFEALRSCTLFIGHGIQPDKVADAVWVPADELGQPLGDRIRPWQGIVSETPLILRELLVWVGVSKELTLKLGAIRGRWEGVVLALEQQIYPMLRFRIELLEKERNK